MLPAAFRGLGVGTPKLEHPRAAPVSSQHHGKSQLRPPAAGLCECCTMPKPLLPCSSHSVSPAPVCQSPALTSGCKVGVRAEPSKPGAETFTTSGNTRVPRKLFNKERKCPNTWLGADLQSWLFHPALPVMLPAPGDILHLPLLLFLYRAHTSLPHHTQRLQGAAGGPRRWITPFNAAVPWLFSMRAKGKAKHLSTLHFICQW